jgi:hypothetical protein
MHIVNTKGFTIIHNNPKKNFKVRICYYKLHDDNITSYTLKKPKHRGEQYWGTSQYHTQKGDFKI